jgi:hypothetical protein
MKRTLVAWLVLTALLSAVAAPAMPNGADPRERFFKFSVDGVHIDGVVGYRIDFTRNPVPVPDQRRLGIAYAPDQRRLVITVTQKGLNRLQDWLNGATDTGAPVSKMVSIQAIDSSDTLLAQWDLTGVVPSTFSSAGAGNLTEVDATIEFIFDKLRLVQANGK